jgi:hypothetical protein
MIQKTPTAPAAAVPVTVFDRSNSAARVAPVVTGKICCLPESDRAFARRAITPRNIPIRKKCDCGYEKESKDRKESI